MNKDETRLIFEKFEEKLNVFSKQEIRDNWVSKISKYLKFINGLINEDSLLNTEVHLIKSIQNKDKDLGWKDFTVSFEVYQGEGDHDSMLDQNIHFNMNIINKILTK